MALPNAVMIINSGDTELYEYCKQKALLFKTDGGKYYQLIIDEDGIITTIEVTE